MAHVHCMLDTHGYKNKLRMCNTYCFCTETVIARTRLIVNVVCTLPVVIITNMMAVLMFHIILDTL